MIVFDKLKDILKEQQLNWGDLSKSGISVNMPARFRQNKSVSTDSINKVCEYLQVQPGDIMEWVPDGIYDSTSVEKAKLERQIEELQEKLKQL